MTQAVTHSLPGWGAQNAPGADGLVGPVQAFGGAVGELQGPRGRGAGSLSGALLLP